MTKTRVFVYGTLLRGQHNHRYLGLGRFVCELRTDPYFTMIDLGGYPGLVIGGHTAITGELFDVDLITLARLDLFEEVPELYRRRQLQLTSTVTAMVYLYPNERARGNPIIESGDWRQR